MVVLIRNFQGKTIKKDNNFDYYILTNIICVKRWLKWIARRIAVTVKVLPGSEVPIVGLDLMNFSPWLNANPVGMLIDFSLPESVMIYGEELRRREMMLLIVISASTLICTLAWGQTPATCVLPISLGHLFPDHGGSIMRDYLIQDNYA